MGRLLREISVAETSGLEPPRAAVSTLRTHFGACSSASLKCPLNTQPSTFPS